MNRIKIPFLVLGIALVIFSMVLFIFKSNNRQAYETIIEHNVGAQEEKNIGEMYICKEQFNI